MRKVLLLLLLAACIPAFGQNYVTGNITGQSTDCSVQGTCVGLTLDKNAGASVVNVSGTFSATLQFEGSNDGGVTFASIAATPVAGGTAVTSATGTGTWRITASGLTNVRVRCSTYVSGTAAVSVSFGSGSASLGGGGTVTNASALTLNHVMLGGGSNAAAVDSALVTDGAGALSGATSVATGTAPAIGTGTGGFGCTEATSTGWTAGAGIDYIRCDSTAHGFKLSYNNGAEFALPAPGTSGNVMKSDGTNWTSGTVSGGGATTFWNSGPSNTNLTNPSANASQVWAMQQFYGGTFSNVIFRVTAQDASSGTTGHTYSFGIYGPCPPSGTNCPRVAYVNSVNMAVGASPTTITVALTGAPVTMAAPTSGNYYYLLWTTDCASGCGTIGNTTTVLTPIAVASGGSTSSGATNATITVPAVSVVLSAYPNVAIF